ncbi:unnamed protein product [Arctogadus glacialis]
MPPSWLIRCFEEMLLPFDPALDPGTDGGDVVGPGSVHLVHVDLERSKRKGGKNPNNVDLFGGYAQCGLKAELFYYYYHSTPRGGQIVTRCISQTVLNWGHVGGTMETTSTVPPPPGPARLLCRPAVAKLGDPAVVVIRRRDGAGSSSPLVRLPGHRRLIHLRTGSFDLLPQERVELDPSSRSPVFSC